MAVTIYEKANGRSVGQQSSTIDYVVTGTTDSATARGAVLDEAPAFLEDLVLIDTRAREAGKSSWVGTAVYGQNQFQKKTADSDPDSSFSTTGGTLHQVTAISQTSFGSSPPDIKNGIGPTKTSINGTDIHVPVWNESETHYFDDSDITATYKGRLFQLTGKVNNAAFRYFAAGECLFMGVEGSKKTKTLWALTFKFAGSPNKTDLAIGDITGISKGGWEQIEVVSTIKTVGTGDDALAIAIPKWVYVNTVYESGDFSDLDIGTT